MQVLGHSTAQTPIVIGMLDAKHPTLPSTVFKNCDSASASSPSASEMVAMLPMPPSPSRCNSE